MLSIRNFTKTYPNGKVAASNINIEVMPGDIYAFIGPNGAGKTTTIRCAVGALDFSDGDILVDSISIKGNPTECKKLIAYIPDNPDIYTTLTGMQYLNFICSIYGVEKSKKTELIKKYADMLELTGDLGMAIGAYSHGMRQKLVLISALIRESKLLVLDEPFVGLDPTAGFKLKELMKSFVAAGGAIFYSTHILEVAEKLCNKVAIIKDGKIITDGTMESVKKDKSLEQVFLGLQE
jgi:ABC-2 type transport system ATP-binding protein